MHIYDFIIVGAGMAGLYAGYRLKKKHSSFLIVDSARKPGGRANNTTFYGSQVVTGAGIGRWEKDRRLRRLYRDMGFKSKPFLFSPNYSINDDHQKLAKMWQTLCRHRPHRSETFKRFGQRVLGHRKYRQFVVMSGYSDYENEDAAQTLTSYGMDDNMGGWKGFSVEWHNLVDRMVRYIGKRHLRLGCKVGEIREIRHRDDTILTVGHGLYARKVLVATDIRGLLSLFPDNDVYRHIHGQPFLRLYARVAPESREVMKAAVPRFTVVDGPLQKLIPINADKGLYMLSYSDNRNAQTVYEHHHDWKWLEQKTEQSLHLRPGTVHITGVKALYFKIGTHYYSPLPSTYRSRDEFIQKARRPMKNVQVIGEVVSTNQGWVEGALETVKI
jgi:glycine/D-amino acid oxidase-like deaminating enzyme